MDAKEAIILGLAPNVELQDIPEGEIWTCNNGYKLYGCVDKLFLMHKQVFVPLPVFDWAEIAEASSRDRFEIIKLHDIPVAGVNYPYAEISSAFNTEYFVSSFDYMVAYAIYNHYHRVAIGGVKFVDGYSPITDDLNEKCGLEHWLGRAIQAGIAVSILSGSTLLKTTTGKAYAIDG